MEMAALRAVPDSSVEQNITNPQIVGSPQHDELAAAPTDSADVQVKTVTEDNDPAFAKDGIAEGDEPATAKDSMVANYRRSSSQTDEDGCDKPPLKYIAFTASHPCLVLCGWWSCCIFFILLIIIASQTSSALYFSMETPFYVKGSIEYEWQDAVKAARREANAQPLALLGINETQLRATQQLTPPRISTAVQIQIMYVAPDGDDIFSLENMKKIASLEQQIISASGKNSKGDTKSYTDYCQIVYDTPELVQGTLTNRVKGGNFNPEGCKIPNSVVGFMTDNYLPLPFPWMEPSLSIDSRSAQNCPLPPPGHPQAYGGSNPHPEAFMRILANILPHDMPVEKLLVDIQKFDNVEFRCEVANELYPGLNSKCATPAGQMAADLCLSLAWNMMAVFDWGRSKNTMWDYSNVSTAWAATHSDFVQYWSSYDPSASPPPDAVHFVPGVNKPFVYGELTDTAGLDRRLEPTVWPNVIRAHADKTFGIPGGVSGPNAKGKAVISYFYLGGPLSNIDSEWTTVQSKFDENDNAAPQNDDRKAWLFNAIHPLLWKFYEDEKRKDDEGIKVTWRTRNVVTEGDPMGEVYGDGLIVPDMLFLLFAMGFIYIYLLFNVRSVFLATMAICMILTSAIPTTAIYLIVLRQKYTGIMQALSMFIILGIGVDDVFVLLECYAHDRDETFQRPLAQDFSAAWRHAAKAMLCTSTTTFFAFLANAKSSFPAISTFGLWCCALVAVNFCCVNTLYVAVVCTFDTYFARYRLCCFGKKPEVAAKPPTEDGAEHLTASMRFFENAYFPKILKLRVPLTLVFVVLMGFYIFSAAQLPPDPDPPALLPASDPYASWANNMIDNYAFDNPYRFDALLVFGIDSETPLNREGTDPAKVSDKGTVNFIPSGAEDDATWVMLQEWMTNEDVTGGKPLGICPELTQMATSSANSLQVATPVMLRNQPAVECPWMHFKAGCQANLGTMCPAWPLPTYDILAHTIMTYFSLPDVQNLDVTNYHRWYNSLYWKNNERGNMEPAFWTIRVHLGAQINMVFEDGNDLVRKWNEWADIRRIALPSSFQRYFYVTSDFAFHYFLVQEKIVGECMEGIILSLALAYGVLLVATRNVIVATLSIVCVSSIVCSTIGFAWWCGWKLGMLEAIVFVMVIGLSVDYVVHLADAYLEASHDDRASRARFMLGKMGMSIVSGASTTLGSSFVLTFTYITFFQKFGYVILFCIFQSLLTSLVFFPALMSLVGPQGNVGKIPVTVQEFREKFGKPTGASASTSL